MIWLWHSKVRMGEQDNLRTTASYLHDQMKQYSLKTILNKDTPTLLKSGPDIA